MIKKIIKKLIVIFVLILQLIQIVGNIIPVHAVIKEGNRVLLKADHKCNDLLQFYLPQYDIWTFKEVWYVCYQDKEDGKQYPAFCVEPNKDGIGMNYSSYDTTIRRESDNRIWRILNKGYMGSNWKEWDLECDDDFYYATKVAVHSLIQEISPKDKYRIGNKGMDGNTVEEVQRRGQKVLDIAQELYEYGISGMEEYQLPKIDIVKSSNSKMEIINQINYYTQEYVINSNKNLKSCEVEIQNFPKETQILNSKNEKIINLDSNEFKIAIPLNEIVKDIEGTIFVRNALVKTNPIYLCKSDLESTQNYVTYMSGFEKTDAFTEMEVKASNASLEILKIDKETQKPIANVTFEVKDENNNKIAEVTTNEKGIAILTGLYPQTVKVKEISVPDKYILSNEEKEVRLEGQKKSSVIFENEKKKGQIKILKLSEDDNLLNGKPKGMPLEGTIFEIRDKEGNVIENITTNEEGIAISSELEIGTYIIKEIKTNENYELTDEEYTIEILQDEEMIELTITNISKKPKLPRTGF